MTEEPRNTAPEPNLGRTLMDDVRRGGFFQNIRREFRELREFMLSEERKERLRKMRD